MKDLKWNSDPDPDELENCRILGKWFAETVDTLVK